MGRDGEWEWDPELGSLQGGTETGSLVDALLGVVESVLMGPAAPEVVAGEVVAVVVMRCRPDEFGRKESRQLGRLLVERYHPLGPVAQTVLTVPAAVAAEVRRRRAAEC